MSAPSEPNICPTATCHSQEWLDPDICPIHDKPKVSEPNELRQEFEQIAFTAKGWGGGAIWPLYPEDLDDKWSQIEALIAKRTIQELEALATVHYAIEGAKRNQTFTDHLFTRIAQLKGEGK